MPGPSKVIVLDPDVRAGRQIQLGFQREGVPAEIATVPPDLRRFILPTEDAGLVVVGGSDARSVDLVRRARELLEANHADAPIVFAGRGATRKELEAAGADEVLAQPAYLRDVVTIGRLLVGQPANHRTHLVGNLAEITGVLTLVRALSALGRSATLTLIRGLRRGEIRFFEGEVTSAQVGLIHGQAALHQLLLWTDARFDYHHEDIVRRQQIPLEHEELFADAERFLAGIRDSSGGLSPAMILEQDITRIQLLGKQVPTEVHSVLRMFDGHRVLADVLEDSPYRVFETLRVAQRAIEVGLLKKAAPRSQKATWRAVLAIEEWLVGAETKEDVVARQAVDATAPVAKADATATGKNKKQSPSRRQRKKRRANTPLPINPAPATKDPNIDWGALVPRTVGREVGPLSGVVPASQRSGEIVLPRAPSRDEPREKLEALMDTGKRERIFPTDVGLEPSVVLDDAVTAPTPSTAAADAKAKADLDAARAKADAEAARAKADAEAARAKAEADAKVKADLDAARAKADAEAARAKADAEAARAKADADAKAKSEADAKAKADLDAARAIADAEAARAKAEADARKQADADAKAKAELDATRAKADAVVARAKADVDWRTTLDADAKGNNAPAKASAEAEARARADAEVDARAAKLVASTVSNGDNAANEAQAKAIVMAEAAQVAVDAETKARAEADARANGSTASGEIRHKRPTSSSDLVKALLDAERGDPKPHAPREVETPSMIVTETPSVVVAVHDRVSVTTTEQTARLVATPETTVSEVPFLAKPVPPRSHEDDDARTTPFVKPSIVLDDGGGAAPSELDDGPSDGVIRSQHTAADTPPPTGPVKGKGKSAAVRRPPPGEIPVDDRPPETTGEIRHRSASTPPPISSVEPSILVADLQAAHSAVSAVAAAQAASSSPAPNAAAAAGTPGTPVATASAEVAQLRRDATGAFTQIEEEFFRAGVDEPKPASPRLASASDSFDDLDEGYEPVGFWDRLLGRRKPKR